MRLKPAPGLLFLELLNVLPEKLKGGYGLPDAKRVAEVQYMFRVTAAGAPLVTRNGIIHPPAEVGDVVALLTHNGVFREKYDSLGFILEGKRYFHAEFDDVLGVFDDAT